MKNDGISLITVIITVIAIIILASISFFSLDREPDVAARSNFTSEINEIKAALGIKRADNFSEFNDMNKGFKEVTLVNSPNDFISISNNSDEVRGYLIDLDLLGYKGLTQGNGMVAGNVVTFDEDDVYVYDKNGTVYYALGFEYDDKIYYNATIYKDKEV